LLFKAFIFIFYTCCAFSLRWLVAKNFKNFKMKLASQKLKPSTCFRCGLFTNNQCYEFVCLSQTLMFNKPTSVEVIVKSIRPTKFAHVNRSTVANRQKQWQKIGTHIYFLFFTRYNSTLPGLSCPVLLLPLCCFSIIKRVSILIYKKESKKAS
jgi:hypothetical protein